MNITQESTGALTAKICIEIEKDDYADKVEQKLKEYRKKMKMPGFREGNVPLGVVNKMYGKALLVEEINHLISDSLQGYLDENNIKTLTSPIPAENQEPIDFDLHDDFSFCFDIGIRPDVNVPFEDITGIKKYQPEADQKSIDEYVNHLRKSYGTNEAAEVVTEDALVTAKFSELNDAGEPFNGNISCENDFLVEKIADDTFKQEILGASRDAVIRMNPMKAFGNRTEVAAILKVKSEELSDPMNDFELIITDISTRKPSEIDKKLLAEVFPADKLENEEQLRTRVAKDIALSYQREADNMMVNDALQTIMEVNHIELPDEYLKRWLLYTDEEGKTTVEDIEAHYNEYADQIRFTLVRNFLIDKHKLSVTSTDMMLFIGRAIGINISEDEEERKVELQTLQGIYEKVISDQKQSEQIKENILEEKLSALLLEKTPFELFPVQIDELNKIIQERNEQRQEKNQ